MQQKRETASTVSLLIAARRAKEAYTGTGAGSGAETSSVDSRLTR